MENGSMHPPGRLEDAGLLELLSHDDRPTFILESNPSQDYLNNQIVFRNRALDVYVREYMTEFECWARTLTLEHAHKQNWTFGGRAWSNTVIWQRWIVVYCKIDLVPVELPHMQAHAHDGPTTRPVRSPPRSGTSNVPAQNADQVVSNHGDTIPSQSVVPRFPSLTDGGEITTEPKIVDWTSHDIPGLPPYINFIKQYDWGSTSLGPISQWPHSLRQVVVCTFSQPDPQIILWGENLVMLYNEAAVPRLGHRHPIALGNPSSDTFAELWPQVAHLIRPAVFEGLSTKIVQELYFMERNGLLEECYWSFIMAPLLGDNGYAEGVIDTFTERTSTVLAQRRRDIVAHLTQVTSQVTSLKDLWPAFLQGFQSFSVDIPYAVLYSVDDRDEPGSTVSSGSLSSQAGRYKLEGCVGLQPDDSCVPLSFDLGASVSHSSALVNACRRALDSRQTVTLKSKDGTLPDRLTLPIPGRGWGDAITHACVMPVAWSNTGALAFLVLALNPRRPFNDDLVRFAHNLRDVLSKPASLISQQRFEVLHDSLTQQLRVSTLAAARNEDKFTKLAESAPVGICTFKPDGTTLYVNNEYLNLFGIPREYDWQALWETGNKWQDEVLPEDLSRLHGVWQTLLERKANSVTIEYRLKRPWISIDKSTGSELVGETWMLNKATAELDEDDNVIFIHAWLLDVSAQHFSENLMAQRLEDALQNKRQSENFIDMVSHELRNPLSAILQSADGILTALEEEESRGDAPTSNASRDNISESAHTIVLCAQHQTCIVNDILTLSKLDSNLLVITPDKVQPPSLIDKVLKMYEAELAGKKIKARLEIETSYTNILHSQDYVMLDPSRLLQVIINLITNAIKFTQFMEERRVTIYLSASYGKPTGAAHDLAFIEPRNLRHEHSTTLSPEWGNGQELYLQFTVTDTGRGLDEEEMKILFQRFSQASPKTYRQYGGSGLGLFISRELTELQGGQIGVSSKGVGKGSTFAFYVRARRCVVLENTDLPSPLGLQHIWETPLPIVGNLAEAEHVSPAATPPLEKPRVSRVPSRRRSRPIAVADDSEDSSKQLHVLVVEDNLINQKVMVQQLRRIGYVVHIANHGLECLSFLQKTQFWKPNNASSVLTLPLDEAVPDLTPLSVVLMDWEMPTMDGLTCVREIRKLQASGQIVSHLPVIAVTANARGEQISVAMEAGMDDLVTKPFRIPDLVPAVEALVAKYPPPGL